MRTPTGLVRLLAIAALITAGLPAAFSASAEAAAPAVSSGTAAAPVLPAPKKLTLVGLDSAVKFTAQFNPKEIAIDKSVPWQKAPTSTGDQPELQFRSAEGRTMAFELEFDTSADGTDVHGAYVSKLVALAMATDPNGPEAKKRPTRVKVTAGIGAIAFEGVIESIGTKYTMFLPDGTPVRATCSVKLKEASRATFVKP